MIIRYRYTLLAACFFLCLMLIMHIKAVAQVFPVEIDPSSTLWIEGSTSVIDYTCTTINLSSTGQIAGLDTTSHNPQGHGRVNLFVSVPVESLNCGKKAMNRDMHKALKSDRFPDINYQLLSNFLVQEFRNADGNRMFEIITYGDLVIAGNQQTEQIMVTGEFLGPWRFRIRGSVPIDMLQYHIDPPAPMMGLIRVDPNLEVHFDVILKLGSYSLSSN